MSDPVAPHRMAWQCMHAEGWAILNAADRISGTIGRAVDLILASRSKVVTTGVGKSGLVARKLAATFNATGQPAVYLHPVEALHGDLGILNGNDILIVISRSGDTPELVGLLDCLENDFGFDANLAIGIIGAPNSPLAQRIPVVLDASVEREADYLDLLPTASTAVAMAVGDALACALMARRGIGAEDLARLHPAGKTERSLRERGLP